MSDLTKIVGGLQEVNKAAATSALIVQTVGGLIGVIKNVINSGKEAGVDVDQFDVAIAGFDAAIATAQTKDAEYQAERDRQIAAQQAEAGVDADGNPVEPGAVPTS